MEKNINRKVCEATEVKDFRELIKNTVTKYPENVAYRYKKDYTVQEPEFMQKTFKQLDNDIKSVATGFLDMGLQGKRIVVIGKNRYEWCVSYLAATTGGMVIVPLDKALPENEIETLVLRSNAEAIIFDNKYIDIAKQIQKDNPKLKHLICMDEIKDKDVIEFSDILENGSKLLSSGDKRYEEMEINPDEMTIMLFTSGTTNLPKAVMVTQRNICSNISSIATWLRLYPTDTLLSFLPIHHTFECTITFLYGLYSGATVAFCDGLKHIQKNLQEYKVTVFVAVPLVLETMYKKIQKAIEDQGKTKLINTAKKVSSTLLKCKIDVRKKLFKQVLDQFGGNLRIVLYGAAPMSKETIIGYNELGIELAQGYGLTETSPVISAETDNEKRPGSVGLVLPNLEAKIENPNEEGIGEITVKGPSIMMGYYENEEETNKVLKDGWFSTGDYGYIDDDGFLYVTGRKKDIIVLKNGKNVYPQEIEFLINKLPYVSESLVYSRDKDTTDTMLCAKIVYDFDLVKEYLGEKSEEEYKEIIWNEVKEINKELPIFKRIKHISITTEPFVKTTTQKVKRYEELKKVD